MSILLQIIVRLSLVIGFFILIPIQLTAAIVVLNCLFTYEILCLITNKIVNKSETTKEENAPEEINSEEDTNGD